jgi:subtilisin
MAEMGRTKIKNFQHLGGLAVNLTDSEVVALRARLGGSVRVVLDEPAVFLQGAEQAKEKPDGALAGKPPGAGGGGSGGGGQQIPWGINAVRAPQAWAATPGRGEGVAVCIVDSGLDLDHPDLVANIGGGANYINGGSWDDDNGHGTHVGGTIAALDNTVGVVGVAPRATLLAAKAFDRRGTGTLGDTADAILGCLSLRDALDPSMPLVVNMSFNITADHIADDIVEDAVATVYATGAMLTGAAGNLGAVAIRRPAAFPGVWAITGAQQDLSFWPSSNQGGWNGDLFFEDPEFIAPATNVLSLWRGGGTKTLEGTSMSTAFASGVAALGLSAGSLGAQGRDIGLPSNQQGMGLIDALLTVQNQPVQASQPASVSALQSSDQSDEDQSSFSDNAIGNVVAFSGLSGAPPTSVPFDQAPGRPIANSFAAIDHLMTEFGAPAFNQGVKGRTLSLDSALDRLFAAT